MLTGFRADPRTGIMMTVFGMGTMLGGPLGGWLNDHYGWQWSFWVQVSFFPSLALRNSVDSCEAAGEAAGHR